MKKLSFEFPRLHLRQIISLFLVCVLFIMSMPMQNAKALDINGIDYTITVWEWFQIKEQKDFPAKGTYPMILTYIDQTGTSYILRNESIGCPNAMISRDGVSHYTRDARDKYVSAVYNRAKEEYISKNVEKAREMTEMELASAVTTYMEQQVYYKKIDADVVRALECMIYGGTNTITATSLTETPSVPFSSDNFMTIVPPTNWSMTVCDDPGTSMHHIKIKAGQKGLYQGKGYWYSDYGRVGEIELSKDSDGHELCCFTSELGGDRARWTQPGTVQLYRYNKGTYDLGLCWDKDRVGGLEYYKESLTNPNYSNFTLYYGKTKTLSVIDQDYTISAGSILYADDNVLLQDGVHLVVAPGGILCVTGSFLCNGVIDNFGTVVINPGATITTMTPSQSNSCQINCYGGKSVSVTKSGGKTEVDKEIDPQAMKDSINALLKEIDALQDQVKDLKEKGSFTYNDETGQAITLAGEEFEAYLQKLEDQVDQRKDAIDQMKEQIEEYEKRSKEQEKKGDTIRFTDCQGDIIIMEGGTLNLCTHSESKLNLNDGATCANNGLILAPNGINIKNAEFLNQKVGTVFSGYYLTNSPGVNCASALIGAGTDNVSLNVKGLSPSGEMNTVLNLNGDYHVRNEGVFVIHGLVSGNFMASSWEGNTYNAK